MKLSTLVACAVCCLSGGAANAAMISLDTVGTDPDLTSPSFTFVINSGGSFNATYHNASNPPMDFITLQLIAPFSQQFYFMNPGGPKAGSSCDGGRAFTMCSVTFFDNPPDGVSYKVEFDFFGTNATHPGLPAGGYISLLATGFQPGSTVGATGTSVPSGIPEPGTFGLAAAAFLLSGFAIGRKKLLEIGGRL